MSRGERRHRTDRKIAQRERIARQSLTGVSPPGHLWHKTEKIGHCSNRGCFICACARQIKRDAVKEARRRAREVEAESDD